MKLRDAAALAFDSLRSARIRTVLTILGLSVGVCAVLTVLTLGEAGEYQVEAEIANLGVDKVWIRPQNARFLLTSEDSEILHKATQSPACASAYTSANVRHGRTTAIAQLAGFDAALEDVHAPRLEAGRFFLKQEYEQSGTVCIVDSILEEALGGNMLGQWIAVANRRLRVIGVIKAMSQQSMAAGNGMVLLPLNTYLMLFGGNIAEITLYVRQGQKTEQVAQAALAALDQKHGYRAVTLEKEINAAREIVRIFVMVLICVAAVCMVTGGIGVMNVLLISVRERQKEIGLMKAIGGTNAQLGLLFLMEAVIYAGLGDVIGTGLGMMLVQGFSRWIGMEAKVRADVVFPVMLAAALMGMCMGVVPAVKAAQMQPVDALRRD